MVINNTWPIIGRTYSSASNRDEAGAAVHVERSGSDHGFSAMRTSTCVSCRELHHFPRDL